MAKYDPNSREGLPAQSKARLAQNKNGLFTSDLSVNEFLMVKQAGFEPLGLVVGSSIYQIGFQQSGLRQSQEMTVMSKAMYDARELAMTRMEEEAEELGADGIVGVRLEIGRYDWGAGIMEFVAIGTAIKHKAGVMHRTAEGRPFTSDLSGQDFWTLLQTGHRPLGLVMGSCVYHVGIRGFFKTMSQMGQSTERTEFTQAMYTARELAMSRMQAEAARLSAGGIVGVEIHEKNHGWGSHVIEFFAIGTAITEHEPDKDISLPTLVLPMGG